MTANREAILAVLAARRTEIASRFGVQWLALFGSAARDQLRPDSDVDVLVAFDGPATFDRYFGLKGFLEAELGRPVDLVTDKGLRKEVRRHVEREAIRVT
jgi:uncharacterized protein